jgi:hypothetical protein
MTNVFRQPGLRQLAKKIATSPIDELYAFEAPTHSGKPTRFIRMGSNGRSEAFEDERFPRDYERNKNNELQADTVIPLRFTIRKKT